MKKLLFFLLISSCIHAQTNMDEFNYITKGMTNQLSSGLDLTKSGYSIEKIDEFTMNMNTGGFLGKTETNNFEIHKISRKNGEHVGIAVVHREPNADVKVFAIPPYNEENQTIFEEAQKQMMFIHKLDYGLLMSILFRVSSKISYNNEDSQN